MGARFLHDEGQVAVLEYTGSLYDKLTSEGTSNFVPRMRVTREFIRTHGDLYDFIIIFTNFEFSRDGADGFYTGVRNDTQGIGEGFYNFGTDFGSSSRLQGVIDMGPISHYQHGLFSIDSNDPRFQTTMSLLAHEVGHRWLAQARFRDASGKVSADLLGRDGNHWSYLLSSDASLFYGSRWESTEEGTFTAVEVRSQYSPLDLYLMGFFDAQEVPSLMLLRSPEAGPNGLPDLEARIKATPETVHVEQIIDVEGPRVPDITTSQKEFHFAFVLLTQGNTLPSPEEMTAIEAIRTGFITSFFTLTKGRAYADTELFSVPPPGTAALPSTPQYPAVSHRYQP